MTEIGQRRATDGRHEPPVSGRLDGVAGVGFVAVLTMMALSSFRLFAPLAYHAVDTVDVRTLVGAVLAVAGVLVVVRSRSRLSGRASLSAVALAAAVLRGVSQWTIPTMAVVVALVVVSASATALGVNELVARSGASYGALAMMVGFTADVAVRGSFVTVDPAWLDREVVASLVVVAELTVLVVAAVSWRGARHVSPGHGFGARGAIAIAAMFLLQLLVLTNIGVVSSRGGWSVGTATGILLAGSVVSMLSLPLVTDRGGTRIVVVGAAAGSVVGASVMPDVGSMVLAVTLGVVCTLTAGLLAVALARPDGSDGRAIVVAIVALVAVPLVAVADQLHYKVALPVDDRLAGVLAAVLIGLAALRPARSPTAAPPVFVTCALAASFAVAGAVIVLHLGLTARGPAAGEFSTATLRVLDYNVDGGIDVSGRLAPAALARAIAAADADVVILQEVSRGWGWSAGVDLAEYLGRRLGMSYAFAPAADDSLGNLILSRAPLTAQRVVSLPRSGLQARRSLLVTSVRVAGRSVTIADLHVQHGRTAAATQARLRQLQRALAAWGQAPLTVLGSDLNAGPGSSELAMMLAAGLTTSADTQACRTPTEAQNCIDWLFVTRDLTEGDVAVLRLGPSDHWPILATVIAQN